MKRNWIAHYDKGSSDKVYIVSIRSLTTGKFQVLSQWARRGQVNMQCQVKGEYDNEVDAADLAQSLFRDKTKKGYIDIESAGYHGPVTVASVSRHLTETVTKDPVDDDDDAAEEAKKSVAKRREDEERKRKEEQKHHKQAYENSTQVRASFQVRCINNIGLEHVFQKDVEYEARQAADHEMLMVKVDGEERELFAERFVRV